jgi:hypothetical protein
MPAMKTTIRTALILFVSAAAAYASATISSAAFGGYSSADVVGTWNCTYAIDVQGRGGSMHASRPIVVRMNANGTAAASATNYAGERGTTTFRWSYRSTGPNTGTITDPPGTGTITWHSRDSVHVQRIKTGPGLLEANYVDCSRG